MEAVITRIIQDLPVELGNDLFERKSLPRENVVQILTSKNSNGLPRWLSGKEPACQSRRQKRRRFHSWVRKIPGVGNGNPLQFSCLENSMDRGAWRAIVHRVAKSWTLLRAYAHTHTHTHTHTHKNNNLQGGIVIFYKEQLSLDRCFYWRRD